MYTLMHTVPASTHPLSHNSVIPRPRGKHLTRHADIAVTGRDSRAERFEQTDTSIDAPPRCQMRQVKNGWPEPARSLHPVVILNNACFLTSSRHRARVP